MLIPESYVGDLNLRLQLYRRLANLSSREEIDGFAAELVDRFGPSPPEVKHLVDTMILKQLCHAANVEKVDAGPRGHINADSDLDDWPPGQALLATLLQRIDSTGRILNMGDGSDT